jgi:hypothetical protein
MQYADVAPWFSHYGHVAEYVRGKQSRAVTEAWICEDIDASTKEVWFYVDQATRDTDIENEVKTNALVSFQCTDSGVVT